MDMCLWDKRMETYGRGKICAFEAQKRRIVFDWELEINYMAEEVQIILKSMVSMSKGNITLLQFVLLLKSLKIRKKFMTLLLRVLNKEYVSEEEGETLNNIWDLKMEHMELITIARTDLNKRTNDELSIKMGNKKRKRKIEKLAEDDENNNNSIFPCLEKSQEDLEKINQDASCELLKVAQKYNRISQPIYEKRRDIDGLFFVTMNSIECREMGKWIMKLDKLRTFSLEKAVCNHGFFMMAPNHWDPSTKTFSRPLRLADSITSAITLISQHEDHLVIKVYGSTSSILSLKDEDERAIQSQVKRMLRLSDKDEQDVTYFHNLHPHAQAKGFGRLFRSPTLFEDVAKSLLLRFCRWKTSLDLAKALCDVQLEKVMSKRKRGNIGGDFPSAEELASFKEEELKEMGKFGYRAGELIKLAKQVVDGRIKLCKFDEPSARFKLKINGVGPFTTHTIMMCAGYYENIPIDSETMRHMKEFHRLNMRKRKKGLISLQKIDKIQQFYKIYHPFQCLAYWFELANSYEVKLGKTLGELLSSEYHHATGNYEKKKY